MSSFRMRVSAGAFGAAVLASGFLIAGCGSSGTPTAAGTTAGHTTPSVAPTPTSEPTPPNPSTAPAATSSSLADFEPPEASGDPTAVALFDQAATSLASVSSVRVHGGIAQDGSSINLDITFAAGKGSTGSIGLGGGTMQILAVGGDTYFKFDKAGLEAFASEGGDSQAIPPAAESLIVGRWLKVPNADQSAFGDVSEFTDLSAFVQSMLAPSGSLSLRSGTTTIEGQQAKTIVDTDAGDVMYVQASGKHLPLEVASGADSSDGTGQLSFSDYNQPVSLVAPSDALDLGALAQLGQSPAAS